LREKQFRPEGRAVVVLIDDRDSVEAVLLLARGSAAAMP
jgi:hypothetical protein